MSLKDTSRLDLDLGVTAEALRYSNDATLDARCEWSVSTPSPVKRAPDDSASAWDLHGVRVTQESSCTSNLRDLGTCHPAPLELDTSALWAVPRRTEAICGSPACSCRWRSLST